LGDLAQAVGHGLDAGRGKFETVQHGCVETVFFRRLEIGPVGLQQLLLPFQDNGGDLFQGRIFCIR